MIVNALCRTYVFLHFPKKEEAPPKGDWQGETLFGLGARRTTSALEMAKKFVSAVVEIQKGGKDKLPEILQTEKKKSLRFSLSLLASPLPFEKIAKAFAEAGLTGGDDGDEECENKMLMTGVRFALKNAHPIVIMRAMTAFLGFSVFDAAETWLIQRFGTKGGEWEELIVPGELPDLVADLGGTAGILSQATRLAGPRLTAAALAGCPKETVEAMKGVSSNELGCILMDSEIIDARTSLSSDELADAQDAFCALLESLKESQHKPETLEEEWGKALDKNLVSDLSELIMVLDDKSLHTIVMALEPKLAAALIQTMTSIAHDRLLSSVAQGRGKKILNALEAASPLGTIELTRNAQIFAQKVLSELVPKVKSPGKAFPLPTKLRQLLTAILSRE